MMGMGTWIKAWANSVQKAENGQFSDRELARAAVAALLPEGLSLSLGCSVPETSNYVPLTP